MYEDSMSSAITSEFATHKMSLLTHNDSHLTELRIIQDWVLLYTRNKTYTHMIYQMNNKFSHMFLPMFWYFPLAINKSKDTIVYLNENLPELNASEPWFMDCYFNILTNITDKQPIMKDSINTAQCLGLCMSIP